MSTEQHDAYGEELARISQYQSEAVTARISVLEALTLAGVSPAQVNELVSKLEAGAVAGAHTWISENSPPHGSEQAFEDGWFKGVRAVASQLLQIADTTASQLGRAESNALQLARIRQQNSRAQAEAPAPAAAAVLDAEEVRAAARRCTWACADPAHFFDPEASEEILAVALSAVRDEERADYAQHLETFADRHRERLEKMLRAYGPGSAPAEYGRYALVGQPESLVLCERLETTPLLLQGLWDGELEDTFLDDLAYAWGAHRHRPRR
ncbi:hypothetical protein KN815_34755 [Streptomyces sp. 4503]|uniref:DUF222 domain-containing protein n=1 Tax=Streptomyces niphimycinicus TaxID=2842201 RepID=A0ABS6CQA8_9ACTN|nr:hypothetical protein [Streptomyces niphimycinicus]MBU3869029.1 hypothetical protein [Streptomyces niphimycinicus]